MTNQRTRKLTTVVVLSLATMLSGCLSKEDSNTDDGASNTTPLLNNPPVISGSPATAVTIGEAYSFTPTASDPDGDPITFSVTNMPGWATFDTQTGTLSGTPVLGHVGNYADIQISVSDGSLSSALPVFPIDVVDVALGSATLSWTPPTENEDGSTFSDLVAYRIYYGTESGNYTNSVQIDNPGISSYVVDSLIPDTYYFVATSVNSSGMESTYSNEAVKEVVSR